jgi:two-component system chemotaxis response regulator CheY
MSNIPRNINFLIADDYFSTRKLLKDHLRSFGFTGEIVEAENMSVARDLIATYDRTLGFIISDMETPSGTGLDLLGYVRNIPGYKNIPFLVLSAVSDKTIIMKSIQGGASNYLIKPWSKELLAQKLEACWVKHYPK